MERKQQIYGDVYVLRITERPRLESNLRKVGKQPWGAESWWLCQFFVTKNGKEKVSWDKPGLVGGLK